MPIIVRGDIVKRKVNGLVFVKCKCGNTIVSINSSWRKGTFKKCEKCGNNVERGM